MAENAGPDDIAYLAGLVRAHDRPRYYAALFAPAAVRADLFAIYGFADEIARVPDLVSEPTLGEIRLTWWREALTGGSDGVGAPAIRAVRNAVERHSLPLAPFDTMIAARTADLYSNAPASMSDVEGRLGETESALFQLAAIILGAAGPDSAEAAGHAGIAYGLARRLSRLAEERARGRSVLPAQLLAQEDLTVVEVFMTDPPPALARVVSAMARFAHYHLHNARERLANVPGPARLAFLPLAIVEPLFQRIGQMDDDILVRPAVISDLAMLSRIAWARLRTGV
ncbi:MAG: phytoene/squalene synthase family protein [Propylenella sp.]